MPIRLIGIDAPEKGKPYYNEARSFLMNLLGNKKVTVEYVQVQNDNYGKLRGYLWVACDYPNQKYCQSSDLQKAENSAKKERLGIWSKE
ncbi:hypothetical protein COV89_00930 [Candidatus Shapirobacteria bacterium CG11_big_fil_rev_8_21_14_0_20_40_12]|uniref:TNase-like domain-containing protein n=3 Tax=Candidatus Shapironibacteriota TaxID=1752721 RepID=A0A2M8EUY4_9BACT|nr:MAG: hypothetical protein COV89_00930 [Candidatus Shapirobacteria bacterium CG11_big_fil_rev_8_21_14_0_20_40_12]PJC28925.1 MAG: hypothetical protein CO053_02065 [Candidatus Shapirobacteria bacterium CG_4_9_14_0_2_um_filter_40_11]PJC77618.1 MAG: hypothetical protein CO010_00115 [Candidatus Shapirobacteria bacterium CG_4_8_14_3_um_filter_39_11]